MPFIGPKPADTVINSSLIDDGTVTTADIADGAITQAKLDSNLVLGGEVATVGDAYKNYNTISADATLTMASTKNYMLIGPLTINNNATFTVAGSSNLLII